MSLMNRLANTHNQYQGDFTRVLTVCSAGLLRSPTIALVLSQPPYDMNCRAAGVTEEYALIVVDDVLLEWAEMVVCAEDCHKAVIMEKFNLSSHKVISLNIQDIYSYRDPKLLKVIREKLDEEFLLVAGGHYET